MSKYHLFAGGFGLSSRLTLVIATLALLIVAASVVYFYNNTQQDGSFRSVELGLAEVSPAGEAAGFAVPASGASGIMKGTPKCGDTTVWVAGWGASCSTICGQYGYAPAANKYGDMCASGENALNDARDDFGGGMGIFRFGCWPDCAQWTYWMANGLGTREVAGSHPYHNYCYNSIGQKRDNDMTDVTVACSCFLPVAQRPVCAPPTAIITQSKATTLVGERFTVTYRPGTAGSATRCELHRRAPGGSLTIIDSNAGVSEAYPQTPGTAGSYQYSARCQNSYGWSAWRSVSHTVVYPPPVANLRVCTQSTSAASCTATTLNPKPTEEIKLRWYTTGGPATSCSAVPIDGGTHGFATGNLTSGMDTTIDEPLSGLALRYSVTCTGPGGNSAPSIVSVSVKAGEGTDIDPPDDPGDPGNDPKDKDTVIIRRGEDITLDYDIGTSDLARCVLKAGEVTIQNPATPTGSITVTVQGETVYSISCDDGANEDTLKVKVLPEVQET